MQLYIYVYDSPVANESALTLEEVYPNLIHADRVNRIFHQLKEIP